MHIPRAHLFAFAAALCLLISSAALAQRIVLAQANGPDLASQIVSAVDDARRVTFAGNTHPLARVQFDQGRVADGTRLRRMFLVLGRSQQQESALKELIDEQQDKSSSSYHQWLTPQVFGQEFGPSERDLDAVTAWLTGHGLSDVSVNAGRTVVEFSGTAGAVAAAFHTEIHQYLVNGVEHIANAGDPSIPAALAPVVRGVASLNDFFPAAQGQNSVELTRDNQTGVVVSSDTAGRTAPKYTATNPKYTTTNASKQTVHAVTPYDFAAIYNVTPLWAGNVDGTGQTIAVVGQSDINAADFVNFRKLFNLPLGDTTAVTGTSYLNIVYNGPKPAITADQGKADAQTQWVGAVAKGATIDYVASATTETTQGSDLSAEYIVDNNLAPVLADSYSVCEASAGSAYNSFIKNLWQQAAAQGITVVAAAGDSGSAGCDLPGSTPSAIKGLAVNALASTPYDVAVGGTDFYLPNGGSGYWSATNDSTTQASAMGYIPETTWNDSCVNSNNGAVSPYTGETAEQVCNNQEASTAGLLTVLGGGGGASGCGGASGSTCPQYVKPSWQTGAGVPADGVRDLPDVSFFAGDGAFGSLYFLCEQSATANRACALGTPSTNFVGTGGTAFASAAFAGVMALVNQKTGNAQGNAGYVLYSLAGQQAKAGTACNATGSPAAGCTFNDITTDTNAMPCATGSPNCTTAIAGDAYGVLSGYSSTAGYDQTTGLGSVNVANLVNNWQNAAFTASNTKLALSPGTVVHGSAVTATVKVTATGGTPTGDVSINAAAANGSVGDGTLTAGSFTASYKTFPGGTYPVHAYYGGDGTYAASESAPVTLTVTPENSTTTETILDQTGKVVSNVPYGDILTLKAVVAGTSGQGAATGNVTLTDNAGALGNGVYLLNSSGYTEFMSNGLAVGSHSFLASYGGDDSFNASTSVADPLTITKAATTATLTASTYNVPDSGTVTFTATVITTSYGALGPSGTVLLATGTGVSIGTATVRRQTPSAGAYDYSVATLTVPASALPAGSNQVTATYSGDAQYLGASATSSQPVVVTATGTPASGTSLVVSPQSLPITSLLTCTATVTGSATPLSGTVQFAIDGQNVGAPVALAANGQATASEPVTGFSYGNHVATATYSGNSANRSSVSPGASFTITTTGTVGSRTAISLDRTTVVKGTVVIVSATVTPVSPVPTGTVQILVDGNLQGSPVALDSNGSASFTLGTSTLQAGSHSIAVVYGGSSTYNNSASGAQTLHVTLPGNVVTSVAIEDLPAAVGQGEPLPFLVQVNPTSPAPTGTLEIIVDGGTPLMQNTITSDPQTLTLDTTGLAFGSHTIAVYYSGNPNYSAATSPMQSFTIVSTNSAFSLSPTVASIRIPAGSGGSGPVVFTVTPVGGQPVDVNFACTAGLPTGLVCEFSPIAVSSDGKTTPTTSLKLAAGGSARSVNSGSPWWMYGGGVSFAGVLCGFIPRRRRGIGTLFAFVVLLALAGASGCGSGFAPVQGPYAITVTATSNVSTNGITVKTATVNLTIGGKP